MAPDHKNCFEMLYRALYWDGFFGVTKEMEN